MRIRFWFCVAMLPSMAAAQPLSTLVEEALRSNREILAAQKKYEAARQRPAQAGSLPDPMVSLGLHLERRPLARGGHRPRAYQ